jgi:hypothetical protein
MKPKPILMAYLALAAGLFLAAVLAGPMVSVGAGPLPTQMPQRLATALYSRPLDMAARPASRQVSASRMRLDPANVHFLAVRPATPTISGTGWQRIEWQDFEGTLPDPPWYLLDGTHRDGGEYLWGQRDCRAHSGHFSMWAGGGGRDGSRLACTDTYTNNLWTRIIYGPVDLGQVVTDAEMQFALWADVEGNGPYIIDRVSWQASPDGDYWGGYSTAGQTGDWVPEHLNLTRVPFFGDLTGQSGVYLSWFFQSNATNPTHYEGAFVDDAALWVYVPPTSTLPPPTPPPPPPTSTSQITRHTTVADFSSGHSLDSTVVVTQYGDGALTLAMQADTSGALGEWERLPSLRRELFYFAAVTAKGRLFIVGGNSPDGGLQRHVYSAPIQDDGLLGHWVELTDLPQALECHAAVVADDYLFVLGGYNFDGGIQRSVFSALINDDGTLGEWTLLPALPEPLMMHSAVSAHGYVYLLGGRTAEDPAVVSDAIYRAVVNANGTLCDWEKLPVTLPRPLQHHTAVAACNHIYLIGGESKVSEWNDVYQAEMRADGSLGAWSPAAPISETLSHHGAAALPGGILVTGGWHSSDPVMAAQKRVYWAPFGSNCTLGEWIELASLPYRMEEHELAAVARYVYNLGGLNHTVPRHFASVLMAPLQLGNHSVQQGTFDHQFDLGDDYFIDTLRWTAEGSDDTGVSIRYRVADAATGEYGPWSDYSSTNTVTINAIGGYLGYQLGFEDRSGQSDKYITDVSLGITSNTAPTIAGLPDQVVPMNSSADNAIDLWAYTSDAEDITATLTFTINNAPPTSAGVTLDDNHYIDITPISGWTGASEVEVQVQDTGGLTDTDTFSITVLANVYLPVVLKDVVR